MPEQRVTGNTLVLVAESGGNNIRVQYTGAVLGAQNQLNS